MQAYPRSDASKPSEQQILVQFDFDVAVLSMEAQEKLAAEIKKIDQHKIVRLVIIGHTDGMGSNTYNQQLGLRRAQAVRAFIARLTALPTQIQMSSAGESAPLASNEADEGRAKNRRVEIQLIANPLDDINSY